MIFHFSLSAFAGGSTSVGPGSPASYACLELGGSGLNFDREVWGGGQVGVCAFSELGTMSMINELSLHRNSEAAHAFLQNEFGRGAGAIEGRARDYCQKVDGKVQRYADHLKATVYYELCEFNDRSSIEIWTLYNGTQYSPKLARAIRYMASRNFKIR